VIATAPVRGLGVPLTGEQEEAVARRDGALLLGANAGSGKTTVLVERFVRAVHDDGVGPGRILAITFTERAAGELRERVRRRLDELGDRTAARETEAAFVSTIHGFCARLLRSHPLAAGLAPGFGVLDEGTASGLREEAFERALEAWMTGPAELDLAAACGVDRLAGAIAAAHDALRSRGMTRPRLPDAGPRHDAVAALAALVDAGGVLARELDAAGPARAGSRVAVALGQLGRVSLADGAGLGVGLDELKLHRGAKALQSAAADAYEAARQACCEARADAGGIVSLDLLGRLLDGFAGEFAGLKRARGALDFDDLELCARDLLLGDAGVRERWSERFELLMVDELQDTNPREMAILGALDRGNLFTVGDEFQSIYGFRHADVGIFRRRRRELAREDGVRALSRNFRSRPPLLAAINATFAPLFGPDFVPLVAGRHPEPVGEPLVELMLSDSAGWQETAPGEEPGPGPPWRRAEAGHLARRIEQLIATGSARPGEIVVLLRYATAAGVYGQALAERGIPVAAALGGGFYAAQEIADLGAYVRVLANPLDDVALYGVLASPLCGLSADGLAMLGLAARASERPPWELMAAAAAEAGMPAAAADEPTGHRPASRALAGLGAEDRERLERCTALIERERRAAGRSGVAELIVRSGYRERALAGRGGELGLANVRKLIRLAREFERREGRDLRAFADRLAAGRLSSSREQHAQLAETDAVRLMTVHAAKGLEFPVVCLADLGHGPPIGAPLILTDGDQVGLRLPTLDGCKPAEAFAYTELRAREGAAALAEEQRIAYVAMTRARDRLILSGAADFAHWPTPGPFAAAIAWLGPAIVGDLPDRLAGPTGVAELDLGGARVRLTLTAAGGVAELPDVLAPEIAVGPGLSARSRPGPERSCGSEPHESGRRVESHPPAEPDPLDESRPPAGSRRRDEPHLLDESRSPAGSHRRDEPHEPDRPAGRSHQYEQISLFDQIPLLPDPPDRPAGPPPAITASSADVAAAVSPALTPPAATPPPAPPPAAPRPGVGRTPARGAGAPLSTHPPAGPPPADRRTAIPVDPPAPAGPGSRPNRPPPSHAAGPPPPGSLSYSSLVDYGRCGYGYYLRRVLGLAEVAPPPGLEPAGYDAARRGLAVHAVLERLDFARPAISPAELARAGVGGSADERAAVAELAGAFARSPLCPRLARAESVLPLRREASFAVTVGDLLVNGTIDVLAREADGRMLVVDYKTDRIDPATDLAERVAADYEIQRRIYGLAALRAGATGVEVAYCFLRRPEEVLSVRYTSADLGELEASLAGLAGPLLAGEFAVAARPHRGLCATCPGRARLCSWPESVTLGGGPAEPAARQAAVQDA
jgi:ATP-dependent helicase/nuclease subunit A